MEYAILFLPLIGSLIGYFGRSLTKYFAEITTSLFVTSSAILAIFVFWNGLQNDIYGNYIIFEWISSENFVANSMNRMRVASGDLSAREAMPLLIWSPMIRTVDLGLCCALLTCTVCI